MTEIRAGEFLTNETTKEAMGGTELMAKRMVRDLDPDLLKNFQIIHSRVRDLDPNLYKILVCHDLANDPEVRNLADLEYRKQFDKIVFVSNWQAQMYNLSHGIPYDEFEVIANGIEPIEYVEKDFTGKLRLIYHTTPHRGLALLIPAFKELSKHFDLHLDVFSSFKAYGWEERDKPYIPLFREIESLPNAMYHGYRSNDIIREYLQHAHIFAYPCIWPETSCIALMEAMSAGCYCIHPNLAALPETGARGTLMYQWNENANKHVNTFYMNSYNIINMLKKQAHTASAVAHENSIVYNSINNWSDRAREWTALLRRIIHEKGSR